MSNILRWGLLSTAHINRVIIPQLKKSKKNQLLAVASREIERASQYAKEWEISKAYGSYEDLLADPEIDVIYNSLPNGLHAEWTVKALQAGKHVLCEKPIATSLEGIDAITVAARKSGKVAVEAFMYRHHAQTLKVKELIKEGAIGRIALMRGIFCFRLTNLQDIRYSSKLGGGSIWDVGCYPISMIRFLYGMEPIKVFAFKVDSSTGIDLSLTGEMNFLGDAVGQIQCSFSTPYHASVEIFGEKGHILLPNPFKPNPEEKFILSQDGTDQEILVKGSELYEGEIEDITDVILKKKQPLISLLDSRNNIKVILNLLESAHTGQPV